MKIVLYVQHIYGNALGPERGCSDKCSSDTQKKIKQFELPALRTNAEYMHLNIILPDRCCSELHKVYSFEQALQFKPTSALYRVGCQ